ncbi:MAG: hypothetical protein LBF15_00975 [Candidatus Peribacteria bacterium]|nr:hypothetical protein [Candidatus Peribacteria bacterium]
MRQNPLKPSKKMTRFRKLLPKKNIKQVITYIVIFFLALAFLSSIVIYIAFIKDLPSVEELENLDIAESSTIYDRD